MELIVWLVLLYGAGLVFAFLLGLWVRWYGGTGRPTWEQLTKGSLVWPLVLYHAIRYASAE